MGQNEELCQVKVRLPMSVAAKYKARLAEEGTTMVADIIGHAHAVIGEPKRRQPTLDFSTREGSRKAVAFAYDILQRAAVRERASYENREEFQLGGDDLATTEEYADALDEVASAVGELDYLPIPRKKKRKGASKVM